MIKDTKNNIESSAKNTKLAYVILVCIAVFIITGIILISTIIEPLFFSIKSRVNQFTSSFDISEALANISNKDKTNNKSSNLNEAPYVVTYTAIKVLGKNKIDDDTVSILAYNSQFDEEYSFIVSENIANQLMIGESYSAVKEIYTNKMNNKYELIVNNSYNNADLSNLELVNTEYVEATILNLRYDDSHVATGGIIQYYLTVTFKDNEYKQTITLEINKEEYNSLIDIESVIINKETYKIEDSLLIKYSIDDRKDISGERH